MIFGRWADVVIGVVVILIVGFYVYRDIFREASGTVSAAAPPAARPVTRGGSYESVAGHIRSGIKLYLSGDYVGTVVSDHNGSDTVDVQTSGGIIPMKRSAVLSFEVRTDDPRFEDH